MSTNGNHEQREDVKWYSNPERKCAGDNRFTNLPIGRNGRKLASELVYLCMQCPVLKECYDDTQKPRKYALNGVVQGGELWR